MDITRVKQEYIHDTHTQTEIPGRGGVGGWGTWPVTSNLKVNGTGTQNTQNSDRPRLRPETQGKTVGKKSWDEQKQTNKTKIFFKDKLMADTENARYTTAWVQPLGNEPKAQMQPKPRHWRQWRNGFEKWLNTPLKAGAAALGQLRRKPAPSQGPHQLRAASVHSIPRIVWAAPPPASSPVPSLPGLPRTGRQKHSSARGPARPLAQRPDSLKEPHSAIFAPSQVRQLCGGRFQAPRLFR